MIDQFGEDTTRWQPEARRFYNSLASFVWGLIACAVIFVVICCSGCAPLKKDIDRTASPSTYQRVQQLEERVKQLEARFGGGKFVEVHYGDGKPTTWECDGHGISQQSWIDRCQLEFNKDRERLAALEKSLAPTRPVRPGRCPGGPCR